LSTISDSSLAALVDPLIRRRPNSAVAIGLSSRGESAFLGFGRLSQEQAALPTGDTVYEIGSVTKVFTSTLLAILVAAGRLELDMPAAALVPELANLPPGITLRRLATHSAGMPPLPPNIIPMMMKNRRNPYASYTPEHLLEYLSTYNPKPLPDEQTKVAYSNLGMGLLGFILSRYLGVSYEQAVGEAILSPLGMSDTAINLSESQHRRLAPAHDGKGKPTSNWDIPTLAGAGALRSTVQDMLVFMAAQLQPPAGLLGQAIENSHTPQRSQAVKISFPERLLRRLGGNKEDYLLYTDGIALGWMIGSLGAGGPQVYWHNGATGGYRAFVGFVPQQGAAVVALHNCGPTEMDMMLARYCIDDVGFLALKALCQIDQFGGIP
jgi:CubicO group peptidase (beta-lactamase class C family)